MRLAADDLGRRAPSDPAKDRFPRVGVRVRRQLASGDEFQLKGDIGGFGVGSKISWQALCGYVHNFELNGLNCSGMIGYGALEVDYSHGGGVNQSGLNGVRTSCADRV